MTTAYIEELAALDRDEQVAYQQKTLSGKPFEQVYQEVRAEFRDRFLDIIKRHNVSPAPRRANFPAASGAIQQ